MAAARHTAQTEACIGIAFQSLQRMLLVGRSLCISVVHGGHLTFLMMILGQGEQLRAPGWEMLQEDFCTAVLTSHLK